MNPNLQTCRLRLNSGEIFTGKLIGKAVNTSGELVFTTGMVGYSEAITDPSYFGQILVFSYPLIGNYGVPKLESMLDAKNLEEGFESFKAHTSGIVISVDSPEVFHWTSFHSLDRWLKEQNVPAVVGIDTRHLVHHIRSHANCLARIEVDGISEYRDLAGLDHISPQGGFFNPSEHHVLEKVATNTVQTLGSGKVRIALLDCGVKWNIIRQLLEQEAQVILVPPHTDPDTIECEGWLLSNGPGDPKKAEKVVQNIQKIIDSGKPILGICLGHQLLSLASGAKTSKMNYGHRSHNQPVFIEGTRKGFISSQNHGYEVIESSLKPEWEVWFRNANDRSIEGIKHKTKYQRSVQFHPEAAAGPRDTGWIIRDFVKECC